MSTTDNSLVINQEPQTKLKDTNWTSYFSVNTQLSFRHALISTLPLWKVTVRMSKNTLRLTSSSQCQLKYNKLPQRKPYLTIACLSHRESFQYVTTKDFHSVSATVCQRERETEEVCRVSVFRYRMWAQKPGFLRTVKEWQPRSQSYTSHAFTRQSLIDHISPFDNCK